MPLPLHKYRQFPTTNGLLDLTPLSHDEEARFCKRPTLLDLIHRRLATRTYAEDIMAREWGTMSKVLKK